MLIPKAATSTLVEFQIQDSSQTDNRGLAGLVFNSASLTAFYYRRGAAAAVQITLVTMTAGTWVSGGFVAVDGTNLPGIYQLGLPNAALASGADAVTVMLKGATNMKQTIITIQLTDRVVRAA